MRLAPKKSASNGLPRASELEGLPRQEKQRRTMVTCQTGAAGLVPLPPGARWIVSAGTPKPLPSAIVREDEAQLVSAAKAGDTHAFEELVNRYERKIFRLGMNITQNKEDAEDVMQDAFLKSYQNLD